MFEGVYVFFFRECKGGELRGWELLDGMVVFCGACLSFGRYLLRVLMNTNTV